MQRWIWQPICGSKSVNFHEYLSTPWTHDRTECSGKSREQCVGQSQSILMSIYPHPELMMGQNAVANQESDVWVKVSQFLWVFILLELTIGQNAVVNLESNVWVKVSQFPWVFILLELTMGQNAVVSQESNVWLGGEANWRKASPRWRSSPQLSWVPQACFWQAAQTPLQPDRWSPYSWSPPLRHSTASDKQDLNEHPHHVPINISPCSFNHTIKEPFTAGVPIYDPVPQLPNRNIWRCTIMNFTTCFSLTPQWNLYNNNPLLHCTTACNKQHLTEYHHFPFFLSNFF